MGCEKVKTDIREQKDTVSHNCACVINDISDHDTQEHLLDIKKEKDDDEEDISSSDQSIVHNSENFNGSVKLQSAIKRIYSETG